jgi:hypothetical protein
MNPPAWPKPVTMTQPQAIRRGEGPLASRKKLLVAESELNRAQLVQAWQTIADEGRALAGQVRTVRSLVSAAASLAAGLASLRRKKTAPAGEKLPWWQAILKGAGLAGSLWSEFRPQCSRRDEK